MGPRQISALSGGTSLPIVIALMPWTSKGIKVLPSGAGGGTSSSPSIVVSDGP